MLQMDQFMERLDLLMFQKGVNKKMVTEQAQISGSAFTDWKTGKSKPTLLSAVRLAEYFSVSLDYLVYGTEPGAGAQDGASASVMQRYNRLPSECQQKVLYYMDGMLAVTEMQGSAQKAS